MRSKWTYQLMLLGLVIGIVCPNLLGQTPPGKQKSPNVEMISPEDLKDKFTKNEAPTIIDVRSGESFAQSTNKIKGAIHIKVRRLQYRLSFPPLKNVPHDGEVITYCSCPSDESSIAAAQILMANGFSRVRVLKGGWPQWLKVNGPVEPKAKGM
ncbi:MAG TPA: rhodanese-like domain-containing protein [Pyrinomonadaceae bacterium]|nr:rhodanese-like domain-containing protein [Pyrinomonadaceae bacterium]